MFSKEKSITYSQRDVPGMTKNVIPHLRKVKKQFKFYILFIKLTYFTLLVWN